MGRRSGGGGSYGLSRTHTGNNQQQQQRLHPTTALHHDRQLLVYDYTDNYSLALINQASHAAAWSDRMLLEYLLLMYSVMT